MQRFPRPWLLTPMAADHPFGPTDCLIGKGEWSASNQAAITLSRQDDYVALHPYPKHGHGEAPPRQGFPPRPRKGREEDPAAVRVAQHMDQVIERTQELEDALEEPENLWPRLRHAWANASTNKEPRVSEIVRQSQEMRAPLSDVMSRLRHVLRRERERVPLDRVQEMDRASIRWLSRQPGRRIVERAGSDQRVLAVVRKESFDTLENRVLHAYARLATSVARDWLRNHSTAKLSKRYQMVEAFQRFCLRLCRECQALDIGIAQPPITPNYVLLEDQGYRQIRLAWERLLRREEVLDDLWAWQAQSWTDFSALAVILAIDELDDSELVSQAPINWLGEADQGRWFDQDNPIATFWLKATGIVVEVQSRPSRPSQLAFLTAAPLFLRISHLEQPHMIRRVAVWPAHAMEPINPEQAASEALDLLQKLKPAHQSAGSERLQHGLILTPAYNDRAQHCFAEAQPLRADVIALDAAGASLKDGLAFLADYARAAFWRELA